MLKKKIIFILLLSAAFLLASCVPAAYRKGVKLSGDYPEKDLPVYKDAIIFESIEDDGELEISYGVKDGDVDDVSDFYKDYFEDNDIELSKEKDDRDEYEARGSYKGFEFKISVEEAKGKYEKKAFETVVEVEIEFTDSADEGKDGDDAIGTPDGQQTGSEKEDSADIEADPDQAVSIPDAELEKLVREAVGVAEGDITVFDMELLYGISIKYDEYPVYDLTGLEYAVNMYHLSYYGGAEHNGRLKSLAPVADLPLLEYISVSYCTVEEAPPVFGTPAMDRASFIEVNNLTDFNFLSVCTGMSQLTVDRCGITSAEFVRGMTELERLSMDDNILKDISPVEDKTMLTSIGLQGNEITDISALASCTSLETVVISYNLVTTLSPLYDLPNLTEVRAYEYIGEKKINQGSIDALVAAGVEVYYHK